LPACPQQPQADIDLGARFCLAGKQHAAMRERMRRQGHRMLAHSAPEISHAQSASSNLPIRAFAS